MVIFVYDLKHYLIPDVVLFPAMVITVVYQLIFVGQIEYYYVFDTVGSARKWIQKNISSETEITAFFWWKDQLKLKNKIYESSDYKNNWSASKESDGVYYFVLNLSPSVLSPIGSEGSTIKTGFVTIVR